MGAPANRGERSNGTIADCQPLARRRQGRGIRRLGGAWHSASKCRIRKRPWPLTRTQRSPS